MRILSRASLAIGFVVALGACSGPGGVSMSTPNEPSASAFSRSVLETSAKQQVTTSLPLPFDEATMTLAKDSTPNLNAPVSKIDRIADLRDRGRLPKLKTVGPAPFATINSSDNGGQAGFNIIRPGVTGVYAGMDVYSGYFSGSSDVLYAPTTRPGDPSCLEQSVVYDHVHANYFVGFYTFCGNPILPNDGGNGYYGRKNINDPGFAVYTTTYLGHKIVTMEIKFLADQKWHGLLYNYSTHLYEDLVSTGGSCYYDSQGINHRSDSPGGCNLFGGNGKGGWGMFETHYYAVGSPCPSTPDIRMYAVQTRDYASNWSLVTTYPGSYGSTSGSYYNYGDCSGAQDISPPYDHFRMSSNLINYYPWDVYGF